MNNPCVLGYGIVSGLPTVTGVEWWGFPAKTVVVALVIAGPIYLGYRALIAGLTPSRENVGNFVVFNALLAILLGGALAVLATTAWETVLLAAGACLGIGFLFGLLFGYPSSQTGSGQTNGAGSTLLQKSVDALSKLVAGATSVEFKNVYTEFLAVAREISRYARIDWLSLKETKTTYGASYVFGSSLTLYFLVLGFLAGILIPHFYPLMEAAPAWMQATKSFSGRGSSARTNSPGSGTNGEKE
jgi:hypothetical protein